MISRRPGTNLTFADIACRATFIIGCACRINAADVSTNTLPSPASKEISFSQDIRPIFERSCIRCHGPTKPKSRFQLTGRELALKGGENGVDIIPGDSAKSPLIHFVARLPEVEDVWMPPPGKGEPLPREEVALLRAWIDQGVKWETSAPPAKVEMTLAPTFGWSTVDGNERVFREHQWLREGWNGGVEEFRLRDHVTDRSFLTIEGHAVADDYSIRLALERPDFGFARAGVERYRKFFSDTGGRYAPFEPDIFRLDRDMYLNIGRAWVDLGFTVPDLPRVAVGYEYQYRDGTKSTLQWGPVTQTVGTVPETRRIYPAYKTIDERVHIIKLDASYSIAGFDLEDRFRGEFYDLDTHRVNGMGLDRNAGQLQPSVFHEIDERQTHFEGANTFRVERQFRDWLFAAAGYQFARLDADAFFGLDWVYPTGPVGLRQNWSTPEIVLDREIHAGSVSTLLGPWAGLTASAGVQGEWSEQHGFGSALIDTSFGPFPPTTATNTMSSTVDRKSLQESLALRYTTIPFTVLFAEARLQQESIDHSEEQNSFAAPAPPTQLFERETEASSDLKDFRGGFTTSPWRRLSLTAHYRRYEKDSYYNHVIDRYFGGPGLGYPAFIRRRKIVSDEIEPKLVWHTAGWLKTTLSYKLVATDFHTAVDPLRVANVVYADDKRIQAGNYDAHVYSINFALTPWQRIYLSTTFSLQDTRTSVGVPDIGAVVPYKGRVYSALASGNVGLTEKNDLHVSYSFSYADYEQHNEREGLPLGIVYHQHGVQGGLTRRVSQNVSASIRYGFFLYDEPTSSGINDYTAHLLFGTVVMKFP